MYLAGTGRRGIEGELRQEKEESWSIGRVMMMIGHTDILRRLKECIRAIEREREIKD